MSSRSRLSTLFAPQNEKLGVSCQRIRYNGTELSPRPLVKDLGLNQGFKSNERIQDGLRRWRVSLYCDNLSGIDRDVALADYDFGKWEISLDNGVTWLKTFLEEPPEMRSIRYIIKLARGITSANLTVTYGIGGGTFTVDPTSGNPVEDTTTETVYASVSQGRTRPTQQDLGGNPSSRLFFEGFFVTNTDEPTEKPINLDLNRAWPATIAIANGETLSGRFTFLPISENSWADQEQKLGSRCQGYFETIGSGS